MHIIDILRVLALKVSEAKSIYRPEWVLKF